MSEGIPYADIIILALIAGFVLLRLRSILGDKVGNDHPQYFNKPIVLPDKQEPIVQLDEKSLKAKPPVETDAYFAGLAPGAVTDALVAIKAKDPTFVATHFLEGAKAAFEMVFDAFTKGDKPTLNMLLADRIFQDFSKEIDARAGAENKTEHTLVSVAAKDIIHASLEGNMAHLTVHFTSEQMTVVRDSKGTIVEGNPSDIHTIENDWTFERDVTSKSPNWKVIET